VLAQLTAFDVLALVLVVGSIAALCGYAGGAGARLLFAVRVDRVEGALFQLLNRAKGAAGGQAAQVQKQRQSSAEKQAEDLAARLMQQPPLDARRRPRGPRWLTGPSPAPTSADQAEQQAFAEIEREQQEARKGSAS